MNPVIKILTEKKLIGKHVKMSLSDNKVVELWKSFMPGKGEIKNRVNTEMISMQVYDASYDFKKFNPGALFEKWAAVEVSDHDIVPAGMEAFTLESGLYAVFFYKGSSADTKIFKYIFGVWLPNSEYELDLRPHFEILGEKYKNNAPDSEEEIWIPVKIKKQFCVSAFI